MRPIKNNEELVIMAINNTAQVAEEEYVEIDTRYGKQMVARSSLLNFPNGIPGFEALTEFKLFHEEDTDDVHFLQSTRDAEIRFPVVTPAACRIDFRLELDDDDLALLEVEPGDDILVLVTLAKQPDANGAGISANLMGPIVINAQSRIGMQKVLNTVDGAVVIDAR
jgi:flagellar assembly factor FliW